jgi:hypothetical protein
VGVLKTHTLTATREERAVNHLNEWGGFSRLLDMPVFTAWEHKATYDKETKTTTGLVLDADWNNAAGANNQERWLKFAEEQRDGIAAFFIIHAANKNAEVKKVKYIDDDRVYIGKIVRADGKVYVAGQAKRL